MQLTMRHAHRFAKNGKELDVKRTSLFRMVRIAVMLVIAAFMASWSLPACAARQTIQKVTVSDLASYVEIGITTTRPLSMESSRIGGKYIVFDLRGNLIRGESKRININEGGIKAVKCGWFRSSPPIARIVVSTDSYRQCSVRYENGKRRVIVKVEKLVPASKVKGLETQQQKQNAGPISTISAPGVGVAPVVAGTLRRVAKSIAGIIALEPSASPISKPVQVAKVDTKVLGSIQALKTETEAVKTVVEAPKPQPRQKVQPKVSLDFVASDIHDVLKALAMQSGVNIVASPDVKGDITVSLNNVTVEEALKLVTNLSGFKFAETDGTYVVGTQDNLKNLAAGGISSSGDDKATDVVVIKYADSTVIGKILEKEFGMVQLTMAGADPKSAGGPTFLVLSGRKAEVEAARTMVDNIENSASEIIGTSMIEVYEVNYVEISELPALIMTAVPGLRVSVGPNQGFKQECPSAVIISSEGGSSGSSGSEAQGPSPKSLVLQGNSEAIEKAKAFLAQIDVQPPQIIIEAKVVDISNSGAGDLGIEWGSEFGKLANIGLTETQDPSQQALTFGRIARNPFAISGQIRAIVESGKGKVLANPNVLALDSKPASIFIGDEIKYVTRIDETEKGITVTTETARVGIQLHSVSRVSSDGYITMNLHPEVSVIVAWKELPKVELALPEISRRFVDSTVRVKDGETIVIGGLIKDDEIKTMSGIPILKDLPFLGGLFEYRHTIKNHSEVVLFITPRIVKT